MSRQSLETYTLNLPSVALTVLELLAFNGQKFRVSRDSDHTPFSNFLRGHVRTVPVNTRVKFEVRSVNRFELLAFNPQNFRGSRDPGHAHLGALLYINFLVLLRRKLCVKFECFIVNGSRNNRGYQITSFVLVRFEL